MSSAVSRPDAAKSEDALAYFQNKLSYETDCWDVHHAIINNQIDFVLLDVRSKDAFVKGHIEGAILMPHWKINFDNLIDFPKQTLFVVYCAGPHCNATEKAAIKLAILGRPVKKMLGGICGWLDEGFELVEGMDEKSISQLS